MTRDERAELAVKIMGVGLLARVLPGLPMYVRVFLRGLAGGRLGNAAWMLAALIAAIALAACLLKWARPLSRRLLLRRDTAGYSASREILHVGTVLVGLSFALAIVVLPLSVRTLGVAVLFRIVPWLVAVVLIIWPEPVVRLAAGFAEKAPLSGRMLGAGLALVGLYLAVEGLFLAASHVSMLLSTVFPAEYRPTYLEMAGPPLAGVTLLAGILFATSGRLGGLLGGRADRGAPARWGSLSPRSCMELALCGATTYALCRYLPWLVRRFSLTVDGPPPVGPVLRVGVMGAFATGLFFLVRLGARPLAGRLWPHTEGEGGLEDPPAALLVLEVAVTVAALASVVSSLGSALQSFLQRLVVSPGAQIRLYGTLPPGMLWAGVAALLLLVLLRGDAAWLMLCWRRDCPAVSRSQRAAVMRPWLILLGAFLAVSHLPSDAVGLAVWISGGHVLSAPSFIGIAGTVMIVLAGPLSRLLAHGRILPRIWRGGRFAGGRQGGVS